MIDTHCHLDLPHFEEDLDEVFSRAETAGFKGFIIPGIEFATIDRIRTIAETRSNVWFASGIHPNNADGLPADWADQVIRDADHPKCVAIGEIGIDYYREYCPHDIQREVFIRQLDIAEELQLPVIIHCRTAYEDLWPILSSWMRRNPGNRAVLHAFDEDAEKALLAVELGIMIGIGGTYTYTKKNERRRDILKAIPMESILLETDCPYLTPHPHRGERNEPAYAELTAEAIAAIKEVPFEEVDLITSANAMRFFQITV